MARPGRGFQPRHRGPGGQRQRRQPCRARSARAGAVRAGRAVLLFDYRRLRRQPGQPERERPRRDVLAAHRFLVHDAGVPGDRLLYHGEKLGAAVVVELAAEHPPVGLVLRSPFVDLAAAGHVHYRFLPVAILLRDRFSLVAQLAAVKSPVTVVYGTRDSIVAAEQSRTVAEAAPALRQLLADNGADHHDPVLLDGNQLINAVVGLADHPDQTR
jgi:fermentation-respiration switch protein FrsA (DUF1100 family)